MLGYIGCMVGVFVMFLMFVYFYLNMFWRKMKWYWLLYDFLVLWIDRLVICVEVGFIILMYFFDLCKMESKVDLCFGIVFFG